MAVDVIATIKPKNGGSFPIAEAVDVEVSEGVRLPEALGAKADKSALAETNANLSAKANAADVETVAAGLQGQINQIEISATAESIVAPEVAGARVGEDGTSYETLKERLDAENGAVSSEIKTRFRRMPFFSVFDDTSVTHGHYIDTNGDIAEYSGWMITDKMEIQDGAQYEGLSLSSSNVMSAFYDATNALISTFRASANGRYPLPSAPANAVYVRFSVPETDIGNFQYYVKDEEIYSARESTSGFLHNSIKERMDADFETLQDKIDADSATAEQNIHAVDTEVKDGFRLFPFYSVFDKAAVTHGSYIDDNGDVVSGDGWMITDRMIIQIGAQYEGISYSSSTAKSAFYDANDTFISAFKASANGVYQLPAIPSNAAYVRFSVPETDIYSFQYYIKNNNNFVADGSVGRKQLSFYLPEYTIETTDATTEGTLIDECIISGGVIDTESQYAPNFFAIEYIPVTPNTDYIGHSNGGVGQTETRYARYVSFYDSEKTYLSGNNNNPLPTAFTTPDDCYYISITIPYIDPTEKSKGVFWLREKSQASNGGKIIIGDDLVIAKESIEAGGSANVSIWHDKRYISHGDSITWYDGHAYPDTTICKGYQSIMNDQIGFRSYVNEGWSGHPMADGTTAGDGIVSRILDIDHSNYDLCTIAAGTNDFKLNVPLGTLGIIGDTNFDTKTFYGAYRAAVEHILTDKPTIRIVLITPLQRNNDGYNVNTVNTAGYKLVDYVDAIKKIGEMYGLPVCDMYAASGFTQLTLSAFTLDGLHPNNPGHARMGNFLTCFVNSVGT